MADNPNDSNEKLSASIKGLANPLEKALDAVADMLQQSDLLNASFVAGRVRMDEMADAVTKTAAGVIRLGGKIGDVSKTMSEIAEGSRRNVIATETQVGKLYAASEILGITTKELVEDFGKVGIETSQIGPNLEKSIKYVQSVGLNAKTVMVDVAKNMELMNRFNFSDGVQGLTKMAAQASMLRFDMNATKNFAEKVLSPEGAIETAAGLQRLGVAAGQLGDPFALMNDSINDPGALQDSLIKATKQFTEFDEKTKTFKINPQGILTLREMAKETGVTYEQLSKSALAAADLDKRISVINPQLNFDKPEDKELLANMATMGEGGEYIVQLRNDKTGDIDKIKLSEITNDELRALRKQQDEEPKTLEDIQKSQLTVQKNIEATLLGNYAKATYGLAGSRDVRGNVIGGTRILQAVSSSIDSNVPESGKISEKINDAVDEMKKIFVDKETGKISAADFETNVGKLIDKLKTSATSMGISGVKALENILKQSSDKITGNSAIENLYKTMASKLEGSLESSTGVKPSYQSKPQKQQTIAEAIQGQSAINRRTTNNQSSTQTSTTRDFNSKVDMSGNITIKVDAPPGVSQQEFKTYFESEEFKRKIYEYYNQKAKELQRTK